MGKSFDRIGDLLEKIAKSRRPFLDECTEAKYMAVQNPDDAQHTYMQLLRTTLLSSDALDSAKSTCPEEIEKLDRLAKGDRIKQGLVSTLKALRSQYLDTVLRPAVKRYIKGSKDVEKNVEQLYDSALLLDELLEIGHFIERVAGV
ncbi:MAG: hypothetical protein KGY80_12250 [Candidatus Thorarchaeota archaeon]|nr:hypothetical protein [Candidatus Thorarchaeota archaeon]